MNQFHGNVIEVIHICDPSRQYFQFAGKNVIIKQVIFN